MKLGLVALGGCLPRGISYQRFDVGSINRVAAALMALCALRLMNMTSVVYYLSHGTGKMPLPFCENWRSRHCDQSFSGTLQRCSQSRRKRPP